MPAGRLALAKAALVGAKTVKGPGPDKVATRPAACTWETSVDRVGSLIAAETTVPLHVFCAADMAKSKRSTTRVWLD